MTGFDQEAFAAAVTAVIQARGLSDRETARQAGVAPSTITRTIRQGKRPDVDNLAALCDWAGLPVDAFVKRHRPIPETPLVSHVRLIAAAHLSADAAAKALGLLLAESGGDA